MEYMISELIKVEKKEVHFEKEKISLLDGRLCLTKSDRQTKQTEVSTSDSHTALLYYDRV